MNELEDAIASQTDKLEALKRQEEALIEKLRLKEGEADAAAFKLRQLQSLWGRTDG